MSQSKYEKPTAKDLSSLQIVEGSCVTGRPEYQMVDCSVTGNVALATCVPGTTVFPAIFCGDGNQAGYSCVNGYNAG